MTLARGRERELCEEEKTRARDALKRERELFEEEKTRARDALKRERELFEEEKTRAKADLVREREGLRQEYDFNLDTIIRMNDLLNSVHVHLNELRKKYYALLIQNN